MSDDQLRHSEGVDDIPPKLPGTTIQVSVKSRKDQSDRPAMLNMTTMEKSRPVVSLGSNDALTSIEESFGHEEDTGADETFQQLMVSASRTGGHTIRTAWVTLAVPTGGPLFVRLCLVLLMPRPVCPSSGARSELPARTLRLEGIRE